MDKYKIPVCNTVFSDKAEIPMTYDLTLPDYLAGITKIIKTDAFAFASSVTFSDGHLTANGRVIIRLTYISDQNSCIKSVVFPFDISHSFDVSGISFSEEAPVTEAKMFVVSAYGKTRNARSAEAKLNVAVCASIHECYEREPFSADKASDLQLRTATDTAVSRKMLSHTPDAIKEDIVLDSGLPAIAELADYTLSMKLEDCFCKNGSLHYSGTAILKCTYRAESTSAEELPNYIRLTKEIPFSGDADSEDIPDGCFVIGKIIPLETEIGSSFDPYGESRIINTRIDYELAFDLLYECETEYATDGFCPGYECKISAEDIYFDSAYHPLNEKHRISERLPADKTTLVHTEDSGFVLHLTGTEASDGKLYAVGKGIFTVTGTDEKGDADCAVNTVNVKIPIDTSYAPPADRKYVLTSGVNSCSAAIRDGEIILEADIEISGAAIERKHITTITGAEIFYESPKPLCRSEYIIYYPEKTESVWDIAKKYEISLASLTETNDISDESQTGLKTVVIPCRI